MCSLTWTTAGGSAAYISGVSGGSGVAMGTASGEVLRVASTGYVGIGTTVPSNMLTVNGTEGVLFGTNYTTIGCGDQHGFVRALYRLRRGDWRSARMPERRQVRQRADRRR